MSFNPVYYNTPAWRQFVMCQEVGHTFGLDHQDEVFNNTNLGSCMDYTNDPDGTLYSQLDNQHPNAHDYDELGIIYGHLDALTTIFSKKSSAPAAVGDDIDTSNPSEWGKVIRKSSDGRSSLYERDLDKGNKLFTFIIWANAIPYPKTTAPISAFAEEVFVDYAAPSHAGPGPHPTTESSDFQLTQGGIRWFSGSTVEYRIVGLAPTGGNAAVEDAMTTWDGFITTRAFARNDVSPTPNNPCTGESNTVQWASIDGSGGILATASVCRNVATKEIVGFVVTVDSGESWASDGSSGNFDVENVASHELGHVAGLGHDNPPRSGCLTMYKLADLGETQKRTLGLGDKLGMDALYGTGDTTGGPGCDL